MRWLLLTLAAVWTLLTVAAYAFILPDAREDQPIIAAYFAIADDPGHENVRTQLEGFRDSVSSRTDLPALPGPSLTSALTLPDADQQKWFDAFRAYHDAHASVPLAQTPRLVWSTDDNPARRTQCDLFRQWHLRTYGEPLDIITDPSNRDITKTVVQCVAGAGPDIIEIYGPAELGQLVDAGVALDITDDAETNGFGVDTVFSAAVPSISRAGRQYAYPCNVGYTVLFYHRDMFRQAGIPEPTGPWKMEELVEVAKKIVGNPKIPSNPRFGFMNYGAWDAALAAGGRFFNTDATVSIYNSPETVLGFRTYRDLMYVDDVMPTPAEAASMAASGGSNMNATAEAASASSLFASKSIAMYVGGRWEYVSLARRNLDRVIRPAAERRLAAIDPTSPEAKLLSSALESLSRDVLVPISDAQFQALENTLTDGDRAQLVQLGVAHVPSPSGTPYYSVAARSAVVNRASPKAELGARFLRFLASPEYNDQINTTFDSICGVPAFCLDEGGISGDLRALPGLEAFNSPVFVEAMFQYGDPWQLSPFIGHARLGAIAGQVMERLTADEITPEEAAKLIEDRINAQMHANISRDATLRKEWERRTGVTFDPSRPLGEQVKRSTPAGGAAQ